MNSAIATACGLLVVVILATGCSTVRSAPPTEGISPAASPATVSPNNIEELSGETGQWPTPAGG